MARALMWNTGTATVLAFRFLPLLIIQFIFCLKISCGYKASLNTDLNIIALAFGNLILIYGINRDLIFNLLNFASRLFFQPVPCKKPE